MFSISFGWASHACCRHEIFSGTLVSHTVHLKHERASSLKMFCITRTRVLTLAAHARRGLKALRHGPPTLSDYVIRLHSAMYTTIPHARSVYAVHARIIIPRGPRVVNTGALCIMYTCTCTCITEDTWTALARFRLQ